jgi:hypothetical protein
MSASAPVMLGLPGPGTPGFVPYTPTAADVAAYQAQVQLNSNAIVPGTASGEEAYQVTEGAQGGTGMMVPSEGAYNTVLVPVPVVSACFNPISQWLSIDTCLGPLGIVEWAIVVVGVYFLFAGGKR